MLLNQMKPSELTEDYNDGYYHIGKDIELNPDAWLYVAWSLRGPGKTYSTLWYMVRNRIPFIYMKRTNIDVGLTCLPDDDYKYSPFKPINRDKGTQIVPVLHAEGMGAFYELNEEGKPDGPPLGSILSFSKASQIKGFDASEADYIIMDEFIPLRGQVVKKDEGNLLLSIYMTVRRDRIQRGRKDLNLILLANGSRIATPITSELSLVDSMADMNADKVLSYFDKNRDIFYHHVTAAEFPKSGSDKDSGIAKAMKGTRWAATELEGEFGYDDFSNIKKMSLKGMRPFIHLHYFQTKDAYIYVRDWDGLYYMTYSPSRHFELSYDLDKENDQKRFWLEQGIDLRMTCICDNMRFLKYSMYDLIINFKNYFNI